MVNIIYTPELVYGMVMPKDNTSMPWGLPYHDTAYPHMYVVQTESKDGTLHICLLWGTSVPLHYNKNTQSYIYDRIQESFNRHEWLSFCCKYGITNGHTYIMPQWQRVNIADSKYLPLSPC